MVPTATQRVYLAAQPWDPCQEVGEMFAPLAVTAPGYTTTLEPTKGCQEVHIGGVPMTYFVYDVPMPDEGTVSVTPGDQPAAELDAAKVATKTGRYARDYPAGRYLWRYLLQAAGDELVGQAVEAIAPDALVVEMFRDRVVVRQRIVDR